MCAVWVSASVWPIYWPTWAASSVAGAAAFFLLPLFRYDPGNTCDRVWEHCSRDSGSGQIAEHRSPTSSLGDDADGNDACNVGHASCAFAVSDEYDSEPLE